jgi:putative membrane protein
MGQMGWWMVLWWVFGLAIVVLLVWAMVRAAAGGFSPRPPEDTPEAILKRRYARGEFDREEYLRRLEDLRR